MRYNILPTTALFATHGYAFEVWGKYILMWISSGSHEKVIHFYGKLDPGLYISTYVEPVEVDSGRSGEAEST
jgi:hypothetical protein